MKISIIAFMTILSINVQAEIAGTSPRKEIENKTSFILPEGVSINDIKSDIFKVFPELLNKETKLDKLLNKPYTVSDENFVQFVFVDYYFDTDNYDLIKKKSAYRLRYRWKNLGLYTRFKFFPFVSTFYPIRVEIQFKEDYFVNENDLMETVESRFEFRKESFPFSQKKIKVPKKPWEYEEFSGYLKTGYFKKFKMMPSYRLETKTGLSLKKNDIKEVFKIETVRNRIHLNMETPWGSGPNVNQAFIISIDSSSSTKDGKEFAFVEIEIEPDRNTSEKLNGIHTSSGGLRGAEIAEFTNEAKEAYMNDLKLVRDKIYLIVEKMGVKKMPLQYKYYRFYEELIREKKK